MSASASASIEPEVNSAAATPEVNGVKSEDSPSVSVDLEKAKKSFQDKAQNYLAEQGRPVIIPSFSKWFNMDEIHDIEKERFPDFFPKDTTKASIYRTGDSYKYIRDFLINCYRLNPLEYLTVTAARRNLAGDVTSIIRVHQFLEKWGLINYQIDPRTKSTLVGPQYTGHFQVTLDTPRGLVPFIPENVKVIGQKESTDKDVEMKDASPVSSPATSVDSESNYKTIPLNLEVRRNVYNETKDFKDSATQYVCSTTGKDTSDIKYYNLKSKGLSNTPGSTVNNATYISEECYEQGLFPSNFLSSNFVKLTKEKELEEWSQQEILLLLEGIEIYGSYDLINNTGSQPNTNSNGQWVKISDHVGSKTKEQCIMKFIQLPIEDRYLTRLIEKKEDKSIDKESLIQEIAKKLISESEGSKILKANAANKSEEIRKDELNLVQQISELTLEKINAKINNLQNLEDNLLNIEKKLTMERKQLAIERWLQYEKILKFKQTNQSPELNNLLDSLLTPVALQEIEATQKKSEDANKAKENSGNANSTDNLPLSVTKPQAYKFWSG